MTAQNTLTGFGNIDGVGSISIPFDATQFTHSYQLVQTQGSYPFIKTFGGQLLLFNFGDFVFNWGSPNLPVELRGLTQGTVITVSGITGPFSSLNGMTFTATLVYDGNFGAGIADQNINSPFFVRALSLGLTDFVSIWQDWGFEYSHLPGLTWNWN